MEEDLILTADHYFTCVHILVHLLTHVHVCICTYTYTHKMLPIISRVFFFRDYCI